MCHALHKDEGVPACDYVVRQMDSNKQVQCETNHHRCYVQAKLCHPMLQVLCFHDIAGDEGRDTNGRVPGGNKVLLNVDANGMMYEISENAN